MLQYKRVYFLLRQRHLLLKHHCHIPRMASSGLVVMSLYSWVFRGKLFSKGTMLPAQRIRPQPAATLVMYPICASEMCSSRASSSRSVGD